ncbi:hypothetical protein QCA50_005966 [Cerrena zonata]|uniref:Uncharacterized protein n=1 Tax=Cerrena zonata TaxID=2478898 RepID=A0AAW0GML6_9APHY
MVLPPSLKSFLSKISRIRRRVPDSSPPSRAHLRAMIYYHESVIRETESALAQKEVEIESALAQKEAEIAECRQHAADLIAERRQHVVEYGRLLNAEVPAIRLPAELLGEIFMEYMIGLRSPNDRENVEGKNGSNCGSNLRRSATIGERLHFLPLSFGPN